MTIQIAFFNQIIPFAMVVLVLDKPLAASLFSGSKKA
jgi:hypothetical protein